MLRWHLGGHFVEAVQVIIELNKYIYIYLRFCDHPWCEGKPKGNQAKQAGGQKLWAPMFSVFFC